MLVEHDQSLLSQPEYLALHLHVEELRGHSLVGSSKVEVGEGKKKNYQYPGKEKKIHGSGGKILSGFPDASGREEG